MGKVEESQDRMGLLKASHDVYFGQDGAKQGMHEVAHVAKRLYLCYQQRGQTLEAYTRECNARKQVCEERGVLPERNVVTAQIAGQSRDPPVDFDSVKDNFNEALAKQLLDKGQAIYNAALHSDGLNHQANGDIKRHAHNSWLMHGVETLPETIEDTIRLVDRYAVQRKLP